MRKNKITVRTIEKPPVTTIHCFLADNQYKDNARNEALHRSKFLCWAADHKRTTAAIIKLGSVTKLIDFEIAQFRRWNQQTILDLLKDYRYQDVTKMIDLVEDFIKKTISNIYD